MGGIVLANQVFVEHQPFSFRGALATGIAALGFAMLERADKDLAVGLAWVAFATAMIAPMGKSKSSPALSLIHLAGF